MCSSLLETHHKATEHHLQYGITQHYLLTDTGECTRPVLDSPASEGLS